VDIKAVKHQRQVVLEYLIEIFQRRAERFIGRQARYGISQILFPDNLLMNDGLAMIQFFPGVILTTQHIFISDKYILADIFKLICGSNKYPLDLKPDEH
jgi:hypothetical protein